MYNKLETSLSPYIGTKEKVSTVMRDVIIALMPVIITAFLYYGIRTFMAIGIAVISGLISEFLACRLMKKDFSLLNGSGLVTCILFALIIPPYLYWWQVAAGASVAIILGKMIFGGLGQNIFNPAFVGLAFLMNSWPVQLTKWGTEGLDGAAGASTLIPKLDGTAGATPLQILKFEGYDKVLETFGGKTKLYFSMFFGNHSGTLGEVSVLAILIGAAYLLVRKQISWHIPFSYVGTVFILYLLMRQDAVFHIMAGGLILGAFFMATDMVTTPLTSKGKIVFGIGAGILTVLIRVKGGFYEGVCYSVLFMNAVTPLINKFFKTKVFGG